MKITHAHCSILNPDEVKYYHEEFKDAPLIIVNLYAAACSLLPNIKACVPDEYPRAMEAIAKWEDCLIEIARTKV